MSVKRFGIINMMLMGRVNDRKEKCQKEWKTKRKVRKEYEKQKKREIWVWWYSVYGKCIDGSRLWHVHGRYLAYGGNIVGGTWPMTIM